MDGESHLLILDLSLESKFDRLGLTPFLMIEVFEPSLFFLQPEPFALQDLQRLQKEVQEQANRDYYVQKMPKNLPSSTLPGTIPGTMTAPLGYWQEKQIVSGGFPATTIGTEQPVYMIQAPAGMYHAPIARPVTSLTGQGFYGVQRMLPPEIY